MRLFAASIVALPASCGFLAHIFRETDSLVIPLLALWLILSLVGLVLGYYLSLTVHSMGRKCILFVLAQFIAFTYLFVVIDSRAKMRGVSESLIQSAR